MSLTPQEIADTMLDLQSERLRDQIICLLLHQNYSPEDIAAAMPEINKCVAKVRAEQAPKILTEVLLTDTLHRKRGKS